MDSLSWPALIAAGKSPQVGQAAHHIVAFTSNHAAPAQAVLLRLVINLNSAANGVLLTANKNTAALYNLTGAIHSKLHTALYYGTVNGLIITAERVGGRPAVEASLKAIGTALQAGAFKY